MQMRIKYNLKTNDGTVTASEIHKTINKVPRAKSLADSYRIPKVNAPPL